MPKQPIMTNFDFLENIPDFHPLYGYCHEAEVNQLAEPEKSALNARMALEYLVRFFYQAKGVDIPERSSLMSLMDDEGFRYYINSEDLMRSMHYIRKVGNRSAHPNQQKVTRKESFFSLLNLHRIVGSVLVQLEVIDTFPAFDKSLIPANPGLRLVQSANVQPQAEVSQKYTDKLEKPFNAKAPQYLSEAETRRHFIDLMLLEAGWDVMEKEGAIMPSKACVEVELQGMPNSVGIGFADYVLFGANGRPLAVVEAKKTSVEPTVGKNQAELYADCLESQYGVRPVIYYTNGFKTWVIDGTYPPRTIYSFHTEKDLELLIQKRSRAAIRDLNVNRDIAGREYQIRAVHAVCEHFNANHRRALLVMATGTGKTRVSVSLVELLMRNNWVKNVLFLADRTALVSQAKKSFVKLLPSASVCVLSDDEHPDMNARIMFSTYQTMINYIDSDVKEFSVGRFDLIIIDEAHRSVFGKYGSIFSYFDALLMGLTATPRDEVDRSTYQLFDLEQGEPNFAYELEEAVEDGFLVSYNVLRRESKIMSDGIKYSDLTSQEKAQLEEVWRYEKLAKALDPKSEYSRDISGSEIFKYLYNDDTIDKVIQDLMENGLKVHDNDLIGKSIIFAFNHKHAKRIVERFYKLYPEYGLNPDFCVLIDNSVKYGQNLIDNFSSSEAEAKKQIRIAVSVDMLDTGIDVPDALNLVFFKAVKSKIKFAQMIGRGTRLCDDLFGPSKNKERFYIFDWCGNFDFFEMNPEGVNTQRMQSLTERLFNIRLDIAVILQCLEYQEDPNAKRLHDELKSILMDEVGALSDNRIVVRMQWDIVSKYKNKDSWAYVPDLEAMRLKDSVSPLLPHPMEDEMAKKFDFLMLELQLSLVDDTVNGEKAKQKVVVVAEALQKKATIPQVKQKMDTIRKVQTTAFWETATLQSLETVRKELRDLIQYLTGIEKKTFIIDIDDLVTGTEATAGKLLPSMTYKQKVLEYLAENTDNNEVLQKIFKLQPLTNNDIRELERIFWQELGTKEDYEHTYLSKDKYKLYGGNIAAFIRSTIGIDRSVALQQFTELLEGSTLTTMQEEYLKSILDYVCQNGDITTETFADEPFSQYEWLQVFGPHTMDVKRYVEKLHGVIAG